MSDASVSTDASTVENSSGPERQGNIFWKCDVEGCSASFPIAPNPESSAWRANHARKEHDTLEDVFSLVRGDSR